MIIFKKKSNETSRKLVRFRCWRFVACIMRCKPGCINLTKFSFHCRFTTRIELFSFSITLYYTMQKTSTNEMMDRYIYIYIVFGRVLCFPCVLTDCLNRRRTVDAYYLKTIHALGISIIFILKNVEKYYRQLDLRYFSVGLLLMHSC